MFYPELTADRVARAKLENRRRKETERQGRIFNDKVRLTGIDKEALDMQVEEKKRQEEAAKMEENIYDADVLQHSKVGRLLQHRQEKERREMERTLVTYRHQHQHLRSRREFDLSDPHRVRNMEQSDGQMTLPGLVGEDQDSESRQLRQKEQLREWLIQQQTDQQEERQQQKMEEQSYDQSRVEIDNKAVELQNFEMERRKAAAIATKDYNMAMIEEKRRQEEESNAQESLLQEGALGSVGVPGLCPSKDRKAPPESLQQVIQFQRNQAEEKKRVELERKQEEERYDRLRLDSARTALLIERQQARLNKQLRRNLDSINVQLAQTHKQQKPDIGRGCIEDSFFSKFNTCSR
ncbi:RIB43A-like with coiled-coils protein 2 [Kryptolebias marmoratus]|uniref:RIB43A domain with coiled-coils 2 n=1 Tax=Kryptolebias marmoratus TaxID=37003 RepID=A0A3Q3BRF8_KRYMA|nr:RIB43A-like with coiled-coils protein 2 [Kryptolebias marmoratus]